MSSQRRQLHRRVATALESITLFDVRDIDSSEVVRLTVVKRTGLSGLSDKGISHFVALTTQSSHKFFRHLLLYKPLLHYDIPTTLPSLQFCEMHMDRDVGETISAYIMRGQQL